MWKAYLVEHALLIAGRLGLIHSRVISMTWKTILPALCSVLMGGCKGTVHMRCFRWLTISEAFTVKAAMWPKARASGNGCCRPLVKKVQKLSTSKTELLHLVLILVLRIYKHISWVPCKRWVFISSGCGGEYKMVQTESRKPIFSS